MKHSSSKTAISGEALQQLLAAALPGAEITLRDDTHKHLLHNEMVDHHGAHFLVRIVWDGFDDWTRLQRHRHVHAMLEQEWSGRQLHSLSLRLMTPDEAAE